MLEFVGLLTKTVISDQSGLPTGSAERRSVVCSCDDNYIPHLATMLQTLADTNDTKDFDLYLVNPGISPALQRKLQRFLERLGIRYFSVLIDNAMFADFTLSGHVTYATYYRLAIPVLLPKNLTRAFYIDVDTCVTGSLDALWDLDFQGLSLAAVECPNQPEMDKKRMGMPPESKYLNAGVMMMNLEKLRHLNLLPRSAQYLQDNFDRVMWWDQDLINIFLQDDWLEIPPIWNLLTKHQVSVDNDYRAEFFDSAGNRCVDQVRIVHFCGAGWSKPWHYNCASEFRHTYLEARAKTPWKKFRLTDQPSLVSRVRRKLARSAHWLRRS